MQKKFIHFHLFQVTNEVWECPNLVYVTKVVQVKNVTEPRQNGRIGYVSINQSIFVRLIPSKFLNTSIVYKEKVGSVKYVFLCRDI